MTDKISKISIITGHYGCGKTNIAVNLALDLKAKGKKVVLVDLDIVNPYFRSADFTKLLNDKGIEVIAPEFANSNLDIPAIPAEVYSVFNDDDRFVILDVGGDDAGAFALGRFSHLIKQYDYKMYFVINNFRYLIQQPEEAVQVMKEIEYASRLEVSCIINNSNLAKLTTPNDIYQSLSYTNEVSKISGKPIAFTTVKNDIIQDINIDEINQYHTEIYPVNVYVKSPWD